MTWNRFKILFIFSTFLLGNTAFLTTSQLVFSTTIFSPDKNSKTELGNIYSACHSLFLKEGAKKDCSIPVIEKNYGYSLRRRSLMNQESSTFVSGIEDTLCALSITKGGSLWMMNSRGRVHNALKTASQLEGSALETKHRFYGKVSPMLINYLIFAGIYPLVVIFFYGRAFHRPMNKFGKGAEAFYIFLIFAIWLYFPIFYWESFVDDAWVYMTYKSYFAWGPDLIDLVKFFVGIICFSLGFLLILAGSRSKKGKRIPKAMTSTTPAQLKKYGWGLLLSLVMLYFLAGFYESSYYDYKKQYFERNYQQSKKLMDELISDSNRLKTICEGSLQIRPRAF